eukprot:scaffold29084_cov15-Tisochrysis_lutea.AAC.1
MSQPQTLATNFTYASSLSPGLKHPHMQATTMKAHAAFHLPALTHLPPPTIRPAPPKIPS